MRWMADDSARNDRSGGFACEVFEDDGSEDGGQPLATVYGKTADEAVERATQIAEAMNARAA
jgi:hypothetical protein